MLIDLQVHSTYSDGYLTPTAVARFLAQQGVKVASLTDHHTLAGWPEFSKACRQLKIKAIPGIELYTRLNNRYINLLWYNLPTDNSEIDKLLVASQQNWLARLRRHIEKLVKAGLLIKKSEAVLAQFTNYVPTNGLIEALLAIPGNRRLVAKQLGGQSFREEEAIGLLLDNKKVGRLRPSCINIERALKLQQKFGGQLVFCHPGKGRIIKTSLMARLKESGVGGLEVLSPHHSLGATMYLQELAERYDLIMTAGSDFHRFEQGSHGLKSAYDYWQADSRHLRRIKEIIG